MNEQIQSKIVYLYQNEKKTTKTISYELGINVKTVIRILKKNNIELRRTKKNLIGNVYGRLKVIKFARLDNSQKAMWECLCECGNHKEIRSGDLLNKKVKSCGCLLSETSRENVKLSHKKYPKSFNFKGIFDLSGSYIRRVKHHAMQKSREYNLSKEFLWQLYISQNRKCAMSGLLIHFGNKTEKQTASLDRIDSTKGYIESNVQWLHKDINNIKQDYSVNELLAYCKLIINNYEPTIQNKNLLSRPNAI